MAATRNNAPAQDRADIYRNQAKAVNELRNAFISQAQASGQFHTQTVSTISASESLTKSIMQQKAGWGQASKALLEYRRNVKSGGGVLGEAIRTQQALRNSSAAQFSGAPTGRVSTDMFIPRNLGSDMDAINTKYGMMNRLLYSAAHQTVNWGKNTQWAGRQIMVGLTVPLGMAAVGAAALAFQVDKELTRVAKVYDTTATTQIGREKELAQVRQTGFDQAKRLAQEYGMQMKDTLEIQAQLAATGLSGKKLFSSSNEAARIATLGEMDLQPAVDMTVALQTAFKDTIKTSDDLTDAFNFFNATENATSLSIKDIAEAIPRAGSAMAALGVDAKQTTVMLVAMKESGVDAAEAANALKAGASAILSPTKRAIETVADVTGKSLTDMVTQAKGNIFEFTKLFSQALHGVDPQKAQKAINDVFGRYQFNRQTALITNLGDAMTGTANQTKKALDLMGNSAEQNANLAAQELTKLQQSTSFKMTAAVNAVKAALIPLGQTALEIAIPILNVIKNIIEGFNSLPGFFKKAILGLAVAGAAVGPLLMITGIMANLFGNVMKVGLQLANLRLRFKATTVEERAAAINAKTASSMFNTEAAAAARLTEQIQMLTSAMERNAIASGQMMTASGKVTQNGFTRQVQSVQGVSGNTSYVYGAGSKSATGAPIAGHPVTNPADVSRYQQIERSAANTASSAERTSTGMSKATRAVGGFAAIAGTAALIGGSSVGISKTWSTILTTVGMVALMAPGLFTSAAAGAVVMAKNMRLAASYSSNIRAGAGGGMAGIKAMIGSFGKAIPMALRIFGPVGIIAGGLLLFKHINDELTKATDQQKALGAATKDWSSAVGFDYQPGQLPGLGESDVSTFQKRIGLVEKMKDANKDLAPALIAAAKAGNEYQAAMGQALDAVTSGASVDQAREVFAASLDMAMVEPYKVDQMLVDFDKIDLSNPDVVRSQIAGLMNDIYANTGDSITIDSSQGKHWWDDVVLGVKEGFGGDLSEAMKSAAQRAGQQLQVGLAAAGNDPKAMSTVFDNVINQTNKKFGDWVNSIKTDPALSDLSAWMDKYGVKTADQLGEIWNQINAKRENGKPFTAAEKSLADLSLNSIQAGTALTNFGDSYNELLDNLVEGYGQKMGIQGAELDELRGKITSILSIKTGQFGLPEALMDAKKAQDAYSTAVSRGASSWAKTTDAEKLRTLNIYRAKAGLQAATEWEQGFADAATYAADKAKKQAAAVDGLADSTQDLIQINAENVGELSNSYQGAMKGAWSDVMDEASRRYDEMRDNVVAGLQKQQDDTDKAYDLEEKNQDAHFDQLEKAQDKHWDQVEKDFDKSWDKRNKDAEDYWDAQEKMEQDAGDSDDKWFDNRIDQLKDESDAAGKSYDKQIDLINEEKDAASDAYDTRVDQINDEKDELDKSTDIRIKAIQDVIDAEDDAEKNRQAIFDAEQRRIERMAESLNTNIDFNVALNSGDLDQAAKISNDASARDQKYNVDDSNERIGSALEQRKAELQAQIDMLEAAKTARDDALDEELKRLEDEKNARDEAFDQEIDRIGKEKEARNEAYDQEIDQLQKDQEFRRTLHSERLAQIKEARDVATEALKTQEASDKENLDLNRQNDKERLDSSRTTAEEDLNNRRTNDNQALSDRIKNAQTETEVDKRELANRLRALQEFVPQNEAELRQHIADVEKIYSDYGFNLQTAAGNWGGYIGQALQTNVDVAAAALQTSINWTEIAANIAGQIGQGMGMTAAQVTEFLRTGVFPAGNPVSAPAYKPAGAAPKDHAPGRLVRHSGGEVGHNGVGFSQADRVGVQRSASTMPSEVPALLKAGEFVVKASQARKNAGLLHAVNNGDGRFEALPRHAGGAVGNKNDIGGPIDELVVGTAMLQMMTAAKVSQIAATKKIQMAQEQAATAGGTIDEGGGSIFQRLFATIKRQFPRANLNSGYRPGDPGYHGKGMAADLGEAGFAGGDGRPYLADMNRWIYDNFSNATELIYNGLGDDRPNLKDGRDFAYNAATQAQHHNHVHWAMTPEAIAQANARGMMGPAAVSQIAAGSVQAQVQAEANRRGWGSGANWAGIDSIVSRESGWNPNAQNPTSTASGLFQHIDATWRAYRSPSAANYAKMRLAPVSEQAYAGINYMGSRYGSPAAARAFWDKNHWYDNGGYLQPGMTTLATNGTSRPEPVFTGPQWDILKANIGSNTYNMPGMTNGAMPVRSVDSNVATEITNQYTITVEVTGPVNNDIDFQRGVERAIENINSRNGRKRVVNS